jgi:uncharacterized protein
MVEPFRELDFIRACCGELPLIPMRIGILSDSHDRSALLARAVRDAADQGAEAVLHCGDVIGANTLRAALECGIPLHVVHGNNHGDTLAMTRLAAVSGGQLVYHGDDARIELAGRRIFVVHYPHYGHALACTGDWDLVCCGHDHCARIGKVAHVRGGTTWLVNPGTIAGIGAPPTYVLGDLGRMDFSVVTLKSNQE